MSLEYYLYYVYYTFLGFPFIIRVAVFFICLFSPIFLYALYRVLHLRRVFYQKKKIQKKIREKYEDAFRSIIGTQENYSQQDIASKVNCNVKKLKDKEKRVLTNLILKLYDEDKDYLNEGNYKRLIDCLQLRQFWERKLKYGSLASRQKALRKLDDLNIEIPGSIITALTYNRNRYIRKRARSSYMYFSKNNPFKFLDEDFDATFNNWDKVEIHRMLQRRLDEGLPQITQWVKNSSNSDFQCFLVDELKFFDQKQTCPFLLEMAETEDINLKKHCIEALGKMKYQHAEEYLIRDYVLQPQIIQQTIVRAVKDMNTGKSLPFLKEAYYSIHDRDSEMIVLDAIYNYGNEGRQLFESMKKDSGGFSKLIFEHVSNPLIKLN